MGQRWMMNHVDFWSFNILQRLQKISLVIRNDSLENTKILLQILTHGNYGFWNLGVIFKVFGIVSLYVVALEKFLFNINFFTVTRNVLNKTLLYWTLKDKSFLKFQNQFAYCSKFFKPQQNFDLSLVKKCN